MIGIRTFRDKRNEVRWFDKPSISLGSDPTCDVVLKSDNSIACEHAKIIKKDGTVNLS